MDLSARLDPTEPTLDATLVTLSSGARPEGACVGFVEGSGCHLTGETRSLLQNRLRIASLVLCLGGLLFVPYRLTVIDWSDPSHLIRFALFIGMLAVLAGLSVLLYRRSETQLRRLRLMELLVFGLPAVYFLALQAVDMGARAEMHGMMHSPVPPWFVLMFTYALFIPNTGRRAAAVLGTMAAAPIALMAGLWVTHAAAAKVWNGEPELFVQSTILLILAAGVGTLGARTIGNLRVEAFRARQLGQYNLRGRIGAGGMGEVYLAEHQMMKRPCAVKLIHPDKAGDPRVLARFEREVRAMAKLSHWNTVEIFDYGRAADGTFYYVMEYLPGMSLSELVKAHGPLPPARAVFLLRQICEALEEAHGVGLLHRDIKPGNIFAAERGGQHDVAKLLDFGLVKPIADMESSRLTQEGTITGSPLYMSPEQATGEGRLDARSDIYSLGAVTYYLLTGRPPFEGDKPIRVIIAHANQQVVPPTQHEPSIPEDLEQVVLRCLEKKPEDRYQSVGELREAFAASSVADGWSRQQAARWWKNLPEPAESEPETAAV